jgi:hypothetical protein
MPVLVAFAIVGAQLVFVLVVRVTGCCAVGYFSWAPNDYSIDYWISASVNGRELSQDEILERYWLAASGFWVDPIEQVEMIVRWRERKSEDDVRVVLRYRVNGHPTKQWVWTDG